MGSQAVEHLRAIGLTEWEGRAYLALLDEAPASGYAVAKRSGVPRSKVYEVLESLLAKGAVHMARADTRLYGPTPPSDLIERLRTDAIDRFDAAEAAVAQHAQHVGGNDVIWDLQGRLEILEHARRTIRSATRRIMIEIWAADADDLRDDLAEAHARGVAIIAVAYGQVDYDFAQIYAHPSTDEVTAGLGGRWLVLSADYREVVAGLVSAGAHSRAAWTSHLGLVVPITELIVHDIYKLEMLIARGDELAADFGPDLVRLRERFAYAQQDRHGGAGA